ncbi:hypothetical protein PSV08DRAFT_244351 [Bipolaris maydis]|uniref:uncharacterized protein n=1 Tax=Cochliobolus heterostrophus TaxID=5016 RepID=UPI0024D91DF6|nr:hypothetical protein J3E73DRAFT_252979 [Bipolaris maydis]KAJ6275318.1 hypothetical protein PSV08DRAFT_244351 [Bipolaris maydis]KAJ6285389.1 hypothetical protein J3E71DRAFT_236293 [Bipolaris maydis]
MGQVILEANGSTEVNDLKKAGFPRSKLSMKDHMFLTSKVKERETSVSTSVQLMYRDNATECVARLKLCPEKAGFESELFKLGDACPPSNNVIMLTDLESPLVAAMSGSEFLHLQTLLTDSANVLWVTCGDHLGAGVDREAAMTQGLLLAIIEQQTQVRQQNEYIDHLVIGLDPAELQKASIKVEGDVGAFWSTDPRFSTLIHSMNICSGGDQGADGDTSSILMRLKAAGAESPAKAIYLVRNQFIAKLSRLFLIDEAEFSADENAERSIVSYGIDSMIGAELRNWIFKELTLELAFHQLFSSSLTISRFSELV